MASVQSQFGPLVQRQQLAADRFVAAAVEQFDLTPEQARAALAKMLKVKVVRLDPNAGQFNLKHGAFWDAAVLRRAAGIPEAPAVAVRPGSILW